MAKEFYKLVDVSDGKFEWQNLCCYRYLDDYHEFICFTAINWLILRFLTLRDVRDWLQGRGRHGHVHSVGRGERKVVNKVQHAADLPVRQVELQTGDAYIQLVPADIGSIHNWELLIAAWDINTER
jgi:hypothetical protein